MSSNVASLRRLMLRVACVALVWILSRGVRVGVGVFRVRVAVVKIRNCAEGFEVVWPKVDIRNEVIGDNADE